MAMHPPGPPYPPTTAGIGGVPTTNLDVPITSVFMFIYLCGAIAHMTIFQLNRKRGHTFIMSAMMFGFCMARQATCIMRIVWATRTRNVRVAIAANILVALGVILLFAINLIFAQRILRASHRHSAWHPFFNHTFTALYILIFVSIAMLVTATIQSFYTLNNNTRRIDRDVMLYGQTFFAFLGFLPIPLVVIGLLIPHKGRIDKFGSGRYRSKVAILLTSAFLLSLGAWFRTGTNYPTPRPASNPAWYHSKACFYIFNFSVEVIVIWLYVLVRVDRRFHVPNGSGKVHGYHLKEIDHTDKTSQPSQERFVETRIIPEEEVLDEEPHDEQGVANEERKDVAMNV